MLRFACLQPALSFRVRIGGMDKSIDTIEFIKTLSAEQIAAVEAVVAVERDELREREEKLNAVVKTLGDRKAELHFDPLGFKVGALLKHRNQVWRVTGHQTVSDDMRVVIQNVAHALGILAVSSKHIGTLQLVEDAQ